MSAVWFVQFPEYITRQTLCLLAVVLVHMAVFSIYYTFCHSSKWFHRGDPLGFDLMTHCKDQLRVSQHHDV